MATKKGELVIMSLGGSIIVPDDPDVKFLKKFRELILKHVVKGKRFIIITGGGKTCRKYQNAARKITRLNNSDIDWVGIHSTRLNAHFIKTLFKGYAHPEIIINPNEKLNFKEKILLGAGWEPGCSSDWDAVMVAKTYGVKKMINLSNVKYVCDRDPAKCKNAKKLKEIDWKGFRKLVGSKWDPGSNLPFDPIASKLAQEIGLEVAIMDGRALANLDNYLSGKKFKGSVIRD